MAWREFPAIPCKTALGPNFSRQRSAGRIRAFQIGAHCLIPAEERWRMRNVETAMNSKADHELVKGILQANLAAVATALVAGADIEACDVHGYPGFPLRIACSQGLREIVEELLRRGARVGAPNRNGNGGAMRLARRGNHDAIVRLLLTYGAEPAADDLAPANLPGESAAPLASSALSTEKVPGAGSRQAGDFTLEAPSFELPDAVSPALPDPDLAIHDVEHLLITGCYGVDTGVLDGDLLRLSQSDIGTAKSAGGEEQGGSGREPDNRSKLKFWKR